MLSSSISGDDYLPSCVIVYSNMSKTRRATNPCVKVHLRCAYVVVVVYTPSHNFWEGCPHGLKPLPLVTEHRNLLLRLLLLLSEAASPRLETTRCSLFLRVNMLVLLFPMQTLARYTAIFDFGWTICASTGCHSTTYWARFDTHLARAGKSILLQ